MSESVETIPSAEAVETRDMKWNRAQGIVADEYRKGIAQLESMFKSAK